MSVHYGLPDENFGFPYECRRPLVYNKIDSAYPLDIRILRCELELLAAEACFIIII